jgi:hypothetical protein
MKQLSVGLSKEVLIHICMLLPLLKSEFLYVQAGCDVRTECQVQYVVKNPYDTCQEEDINNRKRRWRVYLDEIDYITCDFVVLSGKKQ